MEHLVFPDIEALIVQAMKAKHVDQNFQTEQPRDKEVSVNYPLHRIERLSGSAKDKSSLDRASLQWSTWDLDPLVAHDLAQQMRVSMLELQGVIVNHEDVGRAQITSVDELSGPTRRPDTESPAERYIFEMEVHVRPLP